MTPQAPKAQQGKDVSRLRYVAPDVTRQALTKRVGNCRNMGLLLTRYLPWEAIGRIDYLSDRKENPRPEGKWSNQWLLTVASYFPVDGRQDADTQWRSLVRSTYDRCKLTTHGASCFKAEAQSRVIIGLGSKGALETGLTLHPVTGLPTIPGTALKGLCRSYALWSIAEKAGITPEHLVTLDEDLMARRNIPQQATAEARDYHQAFGTTDDSGKCIFFEAVVSRLPARGTLFEADVMTPHYPKYYGSTTNFPSDDQDLNPITFMAVSANTEFAFGVKGVRGCDPKTLKQVVQWLKLALHEFGVGAKTAAGYGVFREVAGTG